MTEQQTPEDPQSLEPPRQNRILIAILFCAFLSAIPAALAGWNGRGWMAGWVGPGPNGLLVGALAGITTPLLLVGSTCLASSWASYHRSRQYVLILSILSIFLLPAWWASGWSGVWTRLLSCVPFMIVLGSIIGLGQWVMRRFAPEIQSDDGLY